MWGDKEEPVTTTRLLLRSMGYRDALIGGLLVHAALRGRDTRGWFLASGGATPPTCSAAWPCTTSNRVPEAGRPRRCCDRHRRRPSGGGTPP